MYTEIAISDIAYPSVAPTDSLTLAVSLMRYIIQAVWTIGLFKMTQSTTAPALAATTAHSGDGVLDIDARIALGIEWPTGFDDDDILSLAGLSPLGESEWDLNDPFELRPVESSDVVGQNVENLPSGVQTVGADRHRSTTSTMAANPATTTSPVAYESGDDDESDERSSVSNGLSHATRMQIAKMLAANPNTLAEELKALALEMGETWTKVRDFVNFERRFTRMMPFIHDLMHEMAAASVQDIVSLVRYRAHHEKVKLQARLRKRITIWRAYCILPLAAGDASACELDSKRNFYRLGLKQQSAYFADLVRGRKWSEQSADDVPSVPVSTRGARGSRKRQACTGVAIPKSFAQGRGKAASGGIDSEAVHDGEAGDYSPIPSSLRKRSRVVSYDNHSNDGDNEGDVSDTGFSSKHVSIAKRRGPKGATELATSALIHSSGVSGVAPPKGSRGSDNGLGDSASGEFGEVDTSASIMDDKSESGRSVNTGGAKRIGLEERLFCLRLMIDNPQIDPPTFLFSVRARYPQANSAKVRGLRDDLLRKLHVPVLVHDELIAQGNSNPGATATELNAAVAARCVAENKKIPSNLSGMISVWTKYCIQPLLSGHSPEPCHPYFPSARGHEPGMHLSTEMSAALFRDLYTRKTVQADE